jgi:transcriptional regulator with XRE-family HTH domain
MPNPSSQLVADWQDLLQMYDVAGIDTDPAEELSPEELRQVNRVYEQGRAAGRERALDAFRTLLKGRIDRLEETAEEVAEHSTRAELENAEARKGPLQRVATEKAEVFGENLDLVYQYLRMTYDELSSVTGISRSTLHTFIRERPAASLGSVYQVAVSLGLHPSVLLAGYQELESFESVADLRALPSEVKEESLGRTTEEMGRLLREDPAGETGDPAEWLSRAERAARKLAPYCPSPGGALGAVIGRHHGGMKGASVAAVVAHAHRSAVEQPDLEGFRYPGPFVEYSLRSKLRNRYWG